MRVHAARAQVLFTMLSILAVVSAVVAVEAAEDSKKNEPFHYDAGGRRDPFVSLVRDGRLVATQGLRIESSKPVLYGILWDPGGNSIALINDGEVKVGDMVGEYRVKEIRNDAVVLDNGGEPVALTIAFDALPSKPAPGTTKGGERP